MRELEAILSAYDEMKATGQPCVLATLVHVEGSSYRQAGARMLINESGHMVGSISGGCLEGDALKKALFALHQGQNKLVTYDTNDEDDAVVGAQLGCNGIVQVLFEPIRFEQPDNPLELLRNVVETRETTVVVTFFNLEKNKTQHGTRLLFDRGMNTRGTLDGPEWMPALKADVGRALAEKRSFFAAYQADETTQHAFIECCLPPPQLVLVGAGNDAQVLAQMANLLGWKVVVADGRYTHANNQRFTGSCQLIVGKPASILDGVHIDARTAFVLMTHNYPYDLAVLKLLLFHPEIPYIGILGPKKKYHRMLAELEDEGLQPTTEQNARIFAPMGLDVGAENAAEIGLAVLAEILAVLNQTRGGHLRERNGPIHDKMKNEFKINRIET